VSPGGEAGFRSLSLVVLVVYHVGVARVEDVRMSQQTTERTCRKSYKEKLRPTPAQERVLEHVLWHCRVLYNTALEQRITAWQRCHVSVTRYQQEAELKAICTEFPEYAAIHSHVLQNVLARLDTTYQAFFRRVVNGERLGFPAFRDAPATTPSPTRYAS
jgi:transposase